MMFREIFRFEFSYQLSKRSTWFVFTALAVIAFFMTRDGTLAEALHDEFFINSPFAVLKTTVVGSLVLLLVSAAITGDAAARDVATGMHPLMYTKPVSKVTYLGGRFLAAFSINAILLIAVQLGIILAVYLPGVDSTLIGPLRLSAYLTAYLYLALPNAFAATALQFLLATQTGRPMAAFLGSLLLFFISYFIATVLVYTIPFVGNLLDNIGVHFILSDLSHLWTPAEKSTRLLDLSGTVLYNRLFWIFMGVLFLGITFLRFHFEHRTAFSWKILKRKKRDSPIQTGPSAIRIYNPSSSDRLKFGFMIPVRQTVEITITSFRFLLSTRAGIAVLIIIPVIMVPVIIDQLQLNGVPFLPATIQVLSQLTSPLNAQLSRWVIIPLLIVFFTGELIWRERDSAMGELTDVLPGSDWPIILGKFFGLCLMLALLMGLLTISGICVQLPGNYHQLDIGLYLKVLFGFQLTEYILFAAMAIAVHVIVDHKYLGHMIALLAYVLMVISPVLGIEHHLLVYGTSPSWSYSEFRGFEPSVSPWLWFKCYWTCWGLLLLVTARLLRVRGKEKSIKLRFKFARERILGPTAFAAAAATVLVLLTGGFIFYNTNVLNDYQTKAKLIERQADYEKTYGRFAHAPQPVTSQVKLTVEIYPEKQQINIAGSYLLFNNDSVAIDSLHLATARGTVLEKLSFDKQSKMVVNDPVHQYRIYKLAAPLAPGSSIRLNYRLVLKPKGFTVHGVQAAAASNGTAFTNELLPVIGYQSSRELTNPADRRSQRLPAKRLIARLDDPAARKATSGNKIEFEVEIGTSNDQVAVATGQLERSWVKNSRRYFRYTTEVPGSEWAFFSARYATETIKWKDITVHIFHHPLHTSHLERMKSSIKTSLAYYTKNFGPYRYKELNVLERPEMGTGMHAEPAMLTYGGGFTLWNPGSGADALDLPSAIIAHEMAHQWTVPYANVEGAPVMSESVAWYYGMKAVENAKGTGQLERLRSFMREPQPYSPTRRGEPLMRGLDPYLSYRKGPFALYAVSEYIGENKVNAALKSLLQTHRKAGAELATTIDLYQELDRITPDSLNYLLADLFKVNTSWDLRTESATASELKDGSWQIAIDLQAQKIITSESGQEKRVPLSDWIEIGVYSDGASSANSQLYRQMHLIHAGKQRINVVVSKKPFLAGIDPRYLLLDMEVGDNMKGVKFSKGK